jgi:3-oxocholest-4-en-26-oyl-CoA dehydrogenase alpha subunit
MDFDVDDRAQQFGSEVRAFLDQELTDDMVDKAWRTGTIHDWDFHHALAKKGWMAPSWPVEEGGQGRDDSEIVAMNEEMARAGAPTDGWRTTMIVAETLRHVGTDDQKKEIIPRILAGDVLVCLGFSEPESGSDVASAQTRAVKDGEHWVINGQKMFTTLAHEASYIFLLTRTNPDVPQHKGLSIFLVPMDSPGIQFSPIETLGDQLVNITFLNDVQVPDSCRVGDIDKGWEVLTVGLALERTVPFGPGPMLEKVVAWASNAKDDLDRPILGDAQVRARLARAAIESEVAKLLFYRSVWTAAQGGVPGIEGSMAKLFGAESYIRQSAALLDAFGPNAMLKHSQESTFASGDIEHSFRYSQYYAIAGGTSEIQRGIIAQRGLGLPRSR